ncbi:ABC transporter permease [Cellulosilyticum sp. ST5]|uniref:ABC transporter permease n=1 Tax=unclassified Cellulosilyticum TaxID=2643091 RepID=UPI000F8C77C3|nr:ABC transporter permease [Cellulosilyticum sp. WCF-2]QEH68659.1 ABC transporter permease [Cellulosilyticum sp. WCF-2]
MFKYSLKRIVSMLITLFLIATITFILMRSIPGGPFTSERALTPEIEKALAEKYNLDAPLWEQYLDYIGDLAKGDLGVSFKKKGVTVNEIIIKTFPASAQIGALAVVLILVIGIPLGVLSALKQNHAIDYVIMIIATIGVTIPSFVIGTFIMYIFGEKLAWIPAGGLESWKSYIGPVIALGGFSIAYVTRLTRSSMLEVLRQDYIRTARANGLSKLRVIGKHALKNALIPVVTYVGPMVASILTGSFVVEKIFAVPGMGKYFVESVSSRDYTVIMGLTIFYAAIYIVMVFIVDIAYAYIDPRIKIKG